MLSIKDVVDLAKAGYKPADVKELIELSKTPDAPASDAQPPQTDQTVSQSQADDKQADKSPATEPTASPQPDDEPDYKALYEAEKAKVNDLQIKNTQTDISAPQTSEKDLLDLVKSFC